MRQTSPFIIRFPIAVVLGGAGILTTGNVTAAPAPTDPVEIAFETTSPYYQPRVAVVPASAPVRWVNATGSHHSVRHDGCLTEETCAFQSVAVPPDSSFLIAPLPPGRYGYHCELHPIMRGTLVVVDPQAGGERMISALEPGR